MSKDIEETIRKAEEAVVNLEKLANQRLDDAEQKIKKGIVKTGIWILVTVGIYFIWGTTWFFWVSFGISAISLIGAIVGKVMMAKARKKMTNDNTDYDFDADIVDEQVDYDEKQKVLETLLNTLEEIGEEHEEIYNADCGEPMSEAVFSSFIFEKSGYVMPNDFGLFTKEGNEAVKVALTKYVNEMLLLAKDADAKERLEMFQDEVYSENGESQNDFFGWVNVDDLENLK